MQYFLCVYVVVTRFTIHAWCCVLPNPIPARRGSSCQPCSTPTRRIRLRWLAREEGEEDQVAGSRILQRKECTVVVRYFMYVGYICLRTWTSAAEHWRIKECIRASASSSSTTTTSRWQNLCQQPAQAHGSVFHLCREHNCSGQRKKKGTFVLKVEFLSAGGGGGRGSFLPPFFNGYFGFIASNIIKEVTRGGWMSLH